MISKSTEYAIRALVYVQLCNWQGKRPGTPELAKEIEAPVAYSGKIMQTLTRHNLLDSMKGRGGGFFFPDNQSNLTLYEVMRVMEGEASFHKCGFGLKQCNADNPCPLHHQYKNIREDFFNLVKTETIKTLAQNVASGKAVLNRVVEKLN